MNKPNCYKCKYRKNIPGNAHSQCGHPEVSEVTSDPLLSIMSLLGSRGLRENNIDLNCSFKKLDIKGNEHGIKNGWFVWPINYDPTWLENCTGFEEK